MDTNTNEQLLDETLDDLADLPAVGAYPPGAHMCDMLIKRDAKKASTYIVEFTHKATLEMVKPDSTSPNPGDKATMFVHTKKKDGTVNDFGQGQLKMILMPLAEKLGTKSVSALIDAVSKNPVEVAITSGIKKQDNYPDQMMLAKIMLT